MCSPPASSSCYLSLREHRGILRGKNVMRESGVCSVKKKTRQQTCFTETLWHPLLQPTAPQPHRERPDIVYTLTMPWRCASSFARRARLPPTIMGAGFCCRELSASSQLSTKQQIEGFTVKDTRPPRPRVAKEKRKQYLAQRKASFEAEQQKAASLGLDWGIRSAL